MFYLISRRQRNITTLLIYPLTLYVLSTSHLLLSVKHPSLLSSLQSKTVLPLIPYLWTSWCLINVSSYTCSEPKHWFIDTFRPGQQLGKIKNQTIRHFNFPASSMMDKIVRFNRDWSSIVPCLICVLLFTVLQVSSYPN